MVYNVQNFPSNKTTIDPENLSAAATLTKRPAEPFMPAEDSPPAKSIRIDEAEDEHTLDEKLLLAGPRIAIHSLDTNGQCTHEVAVPPDSDYAPLRPYNGEPAKEYPFVLDPFQNEAILCLQNSQSVLVSAHTSAGKTVVAE